MNTTLEVVRSVSDAYRAFLRSEFRLRDPRLRQNMDEALATAKLSSGPYLEAMPVFQTGKTAAQVMTELLGTEPDPIFLRAIDGYRPLYMHQERALRLIAQGHNVVVSTGTGSGKTESFLLPILFHLYREWLEGRLGPGVRALILYPMNALVNDQRERLSAIARVLEEEGSPFRFTFGQYVGTTPEDPSDTRRFVGDRNAPRRPGEVIFRKEMRERPPHILLTNYSMLEYLLIRPQDSPFFDRGRARTWAFVVLDEAHQYRGAKGAEMSALLRRLQVRLAQGGLDRELRYVATSATMADGVEAAPQVAEFASRLCGASFESTSVLFSEPLPDPETAGARASRLFGVEEYQEVAHASGRDIAERLAGDIRAARLLGRLRQGAALYEDLRKEVCGDLPHEQAGRTLDALLDLMTKAERANGRPLVSLRYHFFLRALEGAFIRYLPEPRVSLNRGEGADGMASFEIALCRECGQHYLVGDIRSDHGTGRRRQNHLVEAMRDWSDPNAGLKYFLPLGEFEEAELAAAAEAEDDAEEDEGTGSALGRLADPERTWLMCKQCGALEPYGRAWQGLCGHDSGYVFLVEAGSDEAAAADTDDKRVTRCLVCNFGSRSPVRQVLGSADEAHTAIALDLYRRLTPERRKILAFADSRQEAAFFAWQMDRSFEVILRRHVLLSALRKMAVASALPQGAASSGFGLETWVAAVAREIEEREILSPSAGLDQTLTLAWRYLFEELVAPDRRHSLEGSGLIRWFPVLRESGPLWEELWGAVDAAFQRYVPGLVASQGDLRLLVLALLDLARRNGSVWLGAVPSSAPISWQQLKREEPAPPAIVIGARTVQRGRSRPVRWDGPRGRWAKYLAKALNRRGVGVSPGTNLTDLLGAIWEALVRLSDQLPEGEGVLVRAGEGRLVNPKWWRATPLTNHDHVYRCTTCGTIEAVIFADVCPRAGCDGRLEPIPASELHENYYRRLYLGDLPRGRMQVEEHTAQIAPEQARYFQDRFKRGEIHLLSSSTTFELGVDLGDLDVIFLRNVPPEPFNYAQRVGRAGRRPGLPGLAVTYCRRNPHDLYYFQAPTEMIAGHIQPPVLNARNDRILQRHMTALVLGEFFRAKPERFGTVKAFVTDPVRPEGLLSLLRGFAGEHDGQLGSLLRQIIPEELHRSVGLEDDGWIHVLFGKEARLAYALDELKRDVLELRRLEEERREARRYSDARWAQDRLQTVENEDVLSFLSRRSVIPKYGFPVDVVELEDLSTRSRTRGGPVQLQRDLAIAISEFAPGARVIANKHEYASVALKRVPEREWERREYWRCNVHHTVAVGSRRDELSPRCCDAAKGGQFVVPLFGFLSSREPREPNRRPARLFSSRPYFPGWPGGVDAKGNPLPVLRDFGSVQVREASPGQLVILSEGRRGGGFQICTRCGTALTSEEARGGHAHTDPYGRVCTGRGQHVRLGQLLVTDVVELRFMVPLSWLGGGEGDAIYPEKGVTPSRLALSLAAALVEGLAAAVEAPATDLNAVVAGWIPEGVEEDGGDLLPGIFLYDAVPGGAGLVAEMVKPQVLRRTLEGAMYRVDGRCGCGDYESCYGCLRNYRNQFAHRDLVRGPTHAYLGMVRELLETG